MHDLKSRTMVAILLLAAATIAAPLPAQNALSADVQHRIDSTVTAVLASTGAPSASIAVVRNGKIAYTHAYGRARLAPPKPATTAMRYSIGSISKQFTSTAILLLAEEGKLSLDDKASRWLPDLTRANEITVREILSMTSGYQDFWPQDYVMPGMLKPVTAPEIVKTWAGKPLDFDPGTRWQYSNTNYVIAGMIVEKASGMPLMDFLRKRIFTPLGMKSVTNTDLAPLGSNDPTRYMRYALAAPRVAPKEGKGWMFAAGELAMTASDLALWDISMIDQKILKPASYLALETETVLRNGVGTGYGLGVNVGAANGHRMISHGGEVSGFTARNEVYPDDHAAVVVFTNLDATAASSRIAGRIATLLFTASEAETKPAVDQARRIFDDLQHGKIDRSLFTANANAYFSQQAIADFASSLGPLGAPQSFEQTGQSLRGGMVFRAFTIRCGQKVLRLTTFTMPDGKLEQYQIASE